MSSILHRLFPDDGFMPHGMCYLWQPHILALHVICDTVIAAAYFSIPFTLVYFIVRRTDLRFTAVFACFAIFIVACGVTHIMEIVTIWWPVYWVSGSIKAVTALASVSTAFLLAKLVPTALSIPSSASLESANAELSREVLRRTAAEDSVRLTNVSLEARANEVQQQMSALVDSASDAILTKSLDGIICSWNPAAERLLGYTASEIIGQSVTCLIPADRQAEESGILARIQEGYRIANFETVRLKKNGSPVDVSLTISPVVGAGGKIMRVSKIMRDITPQKIAAESLRAVNAELEKRVSSRTSELKERESMLQEIHHRVKNNLQVISSLINMQARAMTDPMAQRALQDCQSRVQTMAQIHEMLYQADDYALIPFSKYTRDLVNRVVSVSDNSSRAVQVNFHMDDVSLSVDRAIPSGLILNELVSNSLKHAFQNESHPELFVELKQLPNSRLLMSVRDNGIGIADHLELHTATSMGLQLIRMLAQQLDAHIDIIRSPGTTFRIVISTESTK